MKSARIFSLYGPEPDQANLSPIGSPLAYREGHTIFTTDILHASMTNLPYLVVKRHGKV